MLAGAETGAPTLQRVTVDVPAKVNLSLHVVGQRDDGYHVLDSVVVFTEAAYDKVTITFGEDTLRLTLSGPFADALPASADNAVIKAARAVGGIAEVHLEKGLPVASGLGGGSADAAAVLRAAVLAGKLGESDAFAIAQTLGADVPVCLLGRACRMRGIGEDLTPMSAASIPALLVNPGVPIETRSVFHRLAQKTNAPMASALSLTAGDGMVALANATRNDLMAPAVLEVPLIGELVSAVAQESGCRFARMSGSGASVFGLFDSDDAAHNAAHSLKTRYGWWTSATRFAAAQ